MKRFQLFLFVFVTALTLVSCYKYPNDTSYLSDFDLVITDYNDTTSFESAKTYILPDTISFIGTKIEDITDADVELSNYILDKIRKNMTARNYIEVNAWDSADFQLAVGTLTVTTTTVYYPGYWYGYPGYWYGGCYTCGWYYPPGYGATYSQYSTGSIVMDLADLRFPDLGSNFPYNATWNVLCNGLLESSNQSNWNRAAAAIDQAFDQSPYLVSTVD